VSSFLMSSNFAYRPRTERPQESPKFEVLESEPTASKYVR